MVLLRPTRPSRTSTLPLQKKKKDILFITRDWNAKVESQEIPRVTGKFGLGVKTEAGQRLTVFSREHNGRTKPFSNNPRHNSTHGDHQMINT